MIQGVDVKNRRFYSYIALSILLAAATAVLIQNLSFHTGLIAGITAFASLGFYELSEKQANRTGKNQKIKISLSLSKPFYEILILCGVSVANIIPAYLAVSVISAVMLSQLLRETTINQLRKNIPPRFGQRIRVLLTALTISLSVFNPFYLFYGMWLIGGLAAYDLLDIIYRSLRE
jgi:hypothetical protein